MLILASQSQIRQELLRQAGVIFTATPSSFDEEAAKPAIANLLHYERALELAAGKAMVVSQTNPYDFVIGADQICADDARTYSKPITPEQAIQHLQHLQGKAHQQHSAVCLFYGGAKIWQHCEIVTLTMRHLSNAEIVNYVAQDEPLQACGAYCYEKNGAALFAKIDGDESAIKGLPMPHLLKALKQFCPEILT